MSNHTPEPWTLNKSVYDAAPELLAALKALAFAQLDTSPELRNALAVIAKATGEQA
jgi:hypothetical protein